MPSTISVEQGMARLLLWNRLQKEAKREFIRLVRAEPELYGVQTWAKANDPNQRRASCRRAKS